MAVRNIDQFRTSSRSFNMTPIIDIVFLLIIFFLIVFQFIDAENFNVNVPDNCKNAVEKEDHAPLTTVTIFSQDQNIKYAIGSSTLSFTEVENNPAKMTSLINTQLEKTPPNQRTVVLRIDKKITFNYTKHALAAISQSNAKNIQLSALKQPQN